MACDNLLTASLLQVVNKLQQAGKIDNLQQACGVFGCVVTDVQSLFTSRNRLLAKGRYKDAFVWLATAC